MDLPADSQLSSTRALNSAVSVDLLLTLSGGGINPSVSPKGNLFSDLKDIFVSQLSGTRV